METIMSLQFASTNAVRSPGPDVVKLALTLGLRSHYVLCLFFHTKIHTSQRSLKALRAWTNLRLMQLQLERQAQDQDQSPSRAKADYKTKIGKNQKQKISNKGLLQSGDFVSSGMYDLVLEARRNRLHLKQGEDTIFAKMKLDIAPFTPADFEAAQECKWTSKGY